MTKKLIWRLGKLPTVDELLLLVSNKTITQEEARNILFNFEAQEDRDKKSLESEIRFLRELVEKLSKNSAITIVETIKYVDNPYLHQPWFRPYATWGNLNTVQSVNQTIGTGAVTSQLNTGFATATLATSGGTQTNVNTVNAVVKFSEIETF